MLRQKLIINIRLLHPVGFLSLHTLLTMHGHRNLKFDTSSFPTWFSDDVTQTVSKHVGWKLIMDCVYFLVQEIWSDRLNSSTMFQRKRFLIKKLKVISFHEESGSSFLQIAGNYLNILNRVTLKWVYRKRPLKLKGIFKVKILTPV